MPSLHHLNPPPNPFWDFVASLDDHPFFAAYAPRNGNEAPGQGPSQPQAAQPTEKAQGKQPAAEDPPEVDPSTVRPENHREMPCRGRGRHHGPPGDGAEGRRGRGCGGRGGSFTRHGNPFGGPHGGPFGHHGPPMMFGPPPFWTGPRHHAHPHNHRHGGRPEQEHARNAPETEQGFNLGDFLNNLGERLGVDLSGAAENFGLDKYTAPRATESVDFEPRTDLFDTANSYVVHLSLPGAKKSDVGVDWDGEHSILRITGVVHRPDVDEQMLSRLVVNGRKRENGVFEKAIRLGTKRDPASVDVAGISAKMTDGVLVVKVPKVEREHSKREVPISGSASPSAAAQDKDLLFDADEEMYDAPEKVAAVDLEHEPAHEAVEDTAKAKADEAREVRSVTAGREDESLPRYQVEEIEGNNSSNDNDNELSDWEKDSEEEGDYVKINVD